MMLQTDLHSSNLRQRMTLAVSERGREGMKKERREGERGAREGMR